MNRTGSRLSRETARELAKRAAESLRRQADALEEAAAAPEPIPAIVAAVDALAGGAASGMSKAFECLLPIVHENERRKAAGAGPAPRAGTARRAA